MLIWTHRDSFSVARREGSENNVLLAQRCCENFNESLCAIVHPNVLECSLLSQDVARSVMEQMTLRVVAVIGIGDSCPLRDLDEIVKLHY